MQISNVTIHTWTQESRHTPPQKKPEGPASHSIALASRDSDAASDDEEGGIAALLNFTPGTTTSPGHGRRWVPYR